MQSHMSVTYLKIVKNFGNSYKNRRIDMDMHEILYDEQLLEVVRKAEIYKSSKVFVDMKLKYDPQTINTNFRDFMDFASESPDKEAVRAFVERHFEPAGTELELWTPEDWQSNPAFIYAITDPNLRKWAIALNAEWKKLGRKIVPNAVNPEGFSSMIKVKYPFIISGQHLREFYYWDSYFIIRGLLHCEMYETVRGMLKNFIELVKRRGFVPAGGRLYYLNRSGPPLLTAMIKAYAKRAKDDVFAINALPVLTTEFEHWMSNRTITVSGHRLAVYGDHGNGPRPELFREDYARAKPVSSSKRDHFYSEVRAAAESGMDFSSRWILNERGSNKGDMTQMNVRAIVPVELNAILYYNAKAITKFYLKAGNLEKVVEYAGKAQKMLKAINFLLWNEEAGVWLDYDTINKKSRNYFAATNLVPLFTKAYNILDSQQISTHIMKYIAKYDLDKYAGGVPITLNRSGEEWDFPYVWPPMQYMLIKGLSKLGTVDASNLSSKWLQRWVNSTYGAYSQTEIMYEKYNAERFGVGVIKGSDTSKGCGWTNGIIIEFLAKHGTKLVLTSHQDRTVPDGGKDKKYLKLVVVILIVILALVLGKSVW